MFGISCRLVSNSRIRPSVQKQEHSYGKQIAGHLRTQYVEGIHRPKYYTVTLKSRLRVTFTYLSCQLHSSGGSEHEVNRRISISRNCMQMLDRHIWRSMISVSTKLRLYNVYTPGIFIWSRNVVHNQSYREEN